MKKYYNRESIEAYLRQSNFADAMRDLRESLFVARYEKGEFVTSPLKNADLFQIVVEGELGVYYIRDDGSVYSLASGQKDYLLGEMALFQKEAGSVYAQASGRLVCLALSLEENRDRLLTNCRFLQLVCESLTRKMEAITNLDAAPATLKQRVLTYMQYKCGGELKGVEQAAFRLHCSARQLQRILNQYAAENVVARTGKGTYRLIPKGPELGL